MENKNATSAWLESASGERTPVRGSCVFGRAATCGVVLPDARVSREHALVHSQQQGEFWLIDLGSANGTYLNGRRVAQPCRLSDGDKITVAEFAFTFNCPAAGSRVQREGRPTEATIYQVRNLTCWLLVADLLDSTQLFRKLPADKSPVVSGLWFSTCKGIVDQHHGTINKYLGDGFLAYWLDGPRTAAAVVKTLSALKKLQEGDGPQFRMVAHYGQVSAGGAASLGEESLTGNEVNFVFRLEKLAAAISTTRLVSEPAQALLKSLLPTTDEGRHPLPGFPGDFSCFSF